MRGRKNPHHLQRPLANTTAIEQGWLCFGGSYVALASNMLHLTTNEAIERDAQVATGLGGSFRLLDGFLRESQSVEGVAFQSLEPGSVLEVTTRHTCYRLFVLNPAQQRALVTGGSLFPQSAVVRVEGATAGGSALKVGWIGVGLRLEMSTGPRRITTSRVQTVVIEAPERVAAPAA